MCYSAMVQQDVKKLGLSYQARVDYEQFVDLLERRLDGEPIKLALGLECRLLQNADTPAERKVKKLIEAAHQLQIGEFETELFKQKKRLADAERKLAERTTKAAENDRRISTQKIESLLKKISKLQKLKPSEGDDRIFPKMHSPLIVAEGGKRLIRLARYHLRPANESEAFDRTHDGCYNARQDSLVKVKFWRELFGQRHGILPILRFYENVERKVGGKLSKVVLCFEPAEGGEIVVPALHAHWGKGKESLDSFAIITSDPNPEVKAAGHDRTPIALKDENIDAWLEPDGKGRDEIMALLDDKRRFYFEHSQIA